MKILNTEIFISVYFFKFLFVTLTVFGMKTPVYGGDDLWEHSYPNFQNRNEVVQTFRYSINDDNAGFDFTIFQFFKISYAAERMFGGLGFSDGNLSVCRCYFFDSAEAISVLFISCFKGSFIFPCKSDASSRVLSFEALDFFLAKAIYCVDNFSLSHHFPPTLSQTF